MLALVHKFSEQLAPLSYPTHGFPLKSVSISSSRRRCISSLLLLYIASSTTLSQLHSTHTLKLPILLPAKEIMQLPPKASMSINPRQQQQQQHKTAALYSSRLHTQSLLTAAPSPTNDNNNSIYILLNLNSLNSSITF